LVIYESDGARFDSNAMDERLAPYVGAIEDELQRQREPGNKIMNLPTSLSIREGRG